MDNKFIEGLRVFKPHEKAPDFVIGSVVITIKDFIQYIKDNPESLTEYNGKKQIRLSIKKGRNGDYYAEVDTYRKEATPKVEAEIDPDDLPF